MLGSIRAEITKAARRPASWLLLAVAVVLTLTFAYVVPYMGLLGSAEGAPSADRGLASMLPDRFVGNSIGGMPVFVGALALIFGALVVGSEYVSETWKTVLAQGPSRMRVYTAKLVTVAVGMLVLALTMFVFAALASVVVASMEDQPVTWPTLADLALGLGAGWLVTMMWASLGILMAVAFRSVALPIGLGLVWLLAVQNLLASIAAPLVDWIAEMQKGMPGPNAGSLVGAVGGQADTPGVTDLVAGGQATLVVAAYLLAFAAVGGWLLSRRDIV